MFSVLLHTHFEKWVLGGGLYGGKWYLGLTLFFGPFSFSIVGGK